MTSLLRALCFGAIVSAAFAAELPVVRTVDIGSLLPNRPPVVVTARPDLGGSMRVPAATEWRGAEGEEMARIAALAPIDFAANSNDLRTVLRAICESAGMAIMIQGNDPVMSEPVTVSGVRHPWEFLQSLGDMYGIGYAYKNRFWYVYAKDSSAPVAKAYVLKHNSLERFRSTSSTEGGGSGGAQNASRSGSSGSGSDSSAANIDRAGQGVFEIDSQAILQEVTNLLQMQSGNVSIADANGMAPEAGPRRAPAQQSQAAVSFISDTNTLYVVASPAQHSIISHWVSMLDQPVPLVKLETKFLLTSVNPRTRKGISSPLNREGGFGISMAELTKEVDPFNAGTWVFDRAVLTAEDVSLRLHALNQSSNTTTVQYPSMTSLAGREVVLRSVRQIPIVSSQFDNTSGGSTNTRSDKRFIDVGTVISILPKVYGDKVLLNLAITVSSVADTVVVGGDPTPIITNQTYTTQVQVTSGLTLALGGLEQSLTTESARKFPLLGDIPFFGFAFKDVAKESNRSVLTMLITPTVLPDYSGGNLTGAAEHTLPSRGTPRRAAFAGTENCTIHDVATSLRGFGTEVAELRQIVAEGRGDSRQHARARLLVSELELMSLTLQRERANGRVSQTTETQVKVYRSELEQLIRSIPNTSPLT